LCKLGVSCILKGVKLRAEDNQGEAMSVAVAESPNTPGEFFVAVSYVGQEVSMVNFYWVLRDMSGEIVDVNQRECRIFPTAVYGEALLEQDALLDMLEDWMRVGESLSTYPLNFNPKQIVEASSAQMRHKAWTGFLESQGGSEFELPSEEDISVFLESGELLGFRTRRELLAAIEQLRVTAIYCEAIDRAQPKPAITVADALSKDAPSGQTTQENLIRARNLIQFARKNGLLSKSQAGIPGGVPTQKAVELANRIRTLAETLKSRGD
jgi:hypothetical protein